MNKTESDTLSKAFTNFIDIIKTLRGPDGCPWDKEQDPKSMRSYLLEEVYELIEAIENEHPQHVMEEIGDVILIVLMMGEMHSEMNHFSIADILKGISDKLIRRHPHVFADQKIDNSEEVLKNWERIKTDIEGRPDSAILGIPDSLPPLERAYKIQKKTAKKGFDWPDKSGPKEKIMEELEEIEKTDDVEAEVGDLFFSLVNYARHLNINPVLALRRCNEKFEQRFRLVEDAMTKAGKTMKSENNDEMNRYWELAKSKIS